MLFISSYVITNRLLLSYLFLGLLISGFLVIKLDVFSKNLSIIRDKRPRMFSPIEFYPFHEFIFKNICICLTLQYGCLTNFNIFTVFDDD